MKQLRTGITVAEVSNGTVKTILVLDNKTLNFRHGRTVFEGTGETRERND